MQSILVNTVKIEYNVMFMKHKRFTYQNATAYEAKSTKKTALRLAPVAKPRFTPIVLAEDKCLSYLQEKKQLSH